MLHAKTVVVLLALAAPFAAAGPLAAFWTPCSKSDPNLNDCMTKSLEKFMAAILKGVPALDIPPLDPIAFGTVDYSKPDLKLLVKDTLLTGLVSNSKIVLVEAEPDKYSLRVNFKAPEVVNSGEYEMSGKLMSLPVQGSGKFALVFKDVSFDIKMSGKGETRDGKNYMVLENVDAKLVPGGMEVQAEGLFNGNKELSDNFHKFAKENWKQLFEDVQDRMWAQLSEWFKKSFTKMYHEVPFNDGIYVA